MRIAVLFSPGSGQQERFDAIGRMILDFSKAQEVWTGADTFGGDYLPDCRAVPLPDGLGYVEKLEGMTEALLAGKPDLFLSVGGDGIASYIAGVMLRTSHQVPMLGIAAGTANAGPIAVWQPEDLQAATPEELTFQPVGAVAAELWNGEEWQTIGVGFNDIVIGDTFLSTINGEMVNLSAEALVLYGRKTPKVPSLHITETDFGIFKNGLPISFTQKSPPQIVTSPLDGQQFVAKAATGALCLMAYASCTAVMTLLDRPLVSVHAPLDTGLSGFVASEQLLFAPDDVLELRGLAPDAHLIIDGNPFLNTTGAARLSYVPQAALAAVRLHKGGRTP